MVATLQRSKTTARVRSDLIRPGLRKIGHLNPSLADIENIRKEAILAGYREGHARNVVFAFRDYLRYLGRDEDAAKAKPGKRGLPPAPRYLTTEELAQFLASVQDVRDRALFAVLANTGLRVHEVVKLTSTDIDLARGLLRVTGKGGKSAEIAIGPAALPILREYAEHRDPRASTFFYARSRGTPPFEGAPQPLSTMRVRKLAHAYGKRAGLRKKVTPHMFRHSLATSLIEAGAPLPIVQRQLRHSRVETTMAYLHISDKAYRESFEKYVPKLA